MHARGKNKLQMHTETAGRSCLTDRLPSAVQVDGTHSLTDMPNMMSVVHVQHLSRHDKHVCQIAIKLSAPAICCPQSQALTRRAWTHGRAVKPVCALLSVYDVS